MNVAVEHPGSSQVFFSPKIPELLLCFISTEILPGHLPYLIPLTSHIPQCMMLRIT